MEERAPSFFLISPERTNKLTTPDNISDKVTAILDGQAETHDSRTLEWANGAPRHGIDHASVRALIRSPLLSLVLEVFIKL